MARMAPAPAQTPSTAAMMGLRTGAQRFDQIAGHAREVEQAVRVHLRERADDLVHIAAGAEILTRPG